MNNLEQSKITYRNHTTQYQHGPNPATAGLATTTMCMFISMHMLLLRGLPCVLYRSGVHHHAPETAEHKCSWALLPGSVAPPLEEYPAITSFMWVKWSLIGGLQLVRSGYRPEVAFHVTQRDHQPYSQLGTGRPGDLTVPPSITCASTVW